MARYSSDSDSDRNSRHRRRYHSRRSRSSSSSSSDGSYHRRSSKRTKSKRRQRSPSRSREYKSQKDKSSASSSRRHRSGRSEKRRHYSSRRSKSSSPDRRKKRSSSRDKSTTSRSSTPHEIKSVAENTAKHLEKQPSAANFGLLSKEDFGTSEPKVEVLEEINAEGFAPKQFNSSRSSKQQNFGNIVIDITADTIQVPAAKEPSSISESIFHTSIMMDRSAKFDKWVRKLYVMRQKALAENNHPSLS